jgi:hypothetical protein
MLSNAIVASALATCYVLLVVLQLNPTLPLHPVRLVPLALTIGPFYLLHLTVIAYALLVLAPLFSGERFSPGWLSVRTLSWLGAFAAAAGAALMWANVDTFALVLEPETARAMTSGGVAVAAASALFGIVALSRPRVRSGPRVTAAVCLVVIAAGSVVIPMVLRGRGVVEPLAAHGIDATLDVPEPERQARVVLIAIDGGSLDLVTHATAEGRLPNFGRILDAGAVMHLATLHPTSAQAVWAAVATGKLPQKNGVRSANIYRPTGSDEPIRLLPDFCFASRLVRSGLLADEPHTAATLRARTIWSVVSAEGLPVGVINWPLTDPASPVRGYIVSDTYAEATFAGALTEGHLMLYPPSLEADTLPLVDASLLEPNDIVPAGLQSVVELRHQQPGRVDRAYDRIARALQDSRPTQVTMVRYESLDPVGHYFLRYAMPSRFGDISDVGDSERRRLAPVLERHYALIDEAIGRAMSSLGPDDLLLVVSGYGMEPLGFGKRLLEQAIGDPEVSGTHEAAPDGFLMAYGASVQKGRLLRRASVVDVVPTMLYFLGLPIGRDMDGYARTDLFAQTFTDERPIAFIPTYEQ